MLENATVNETKELWWSIYAWWTCVLVLKMMLLTWFTGQIRVREQVIHSEEDRMWMVKNTPKITLCPTGDGHPDVIRIRRAHQKDLKTVLPFLVLTPLWLNVETCNSTVKILIPCFALSSILYTLLHMKLQMSVSWKHLFSIVLYCILTYICTITAIRYCGSYAKY